MIVHVAVQCIWMCVYMYVTSFDAIGKNPNAECD